MDVFTWSLPFVGEKSQPATRFPLFCSANGFAVTDMLIAILNCCTKEELEEDEETPMVITPEESEGGCHYIVKRSVLIGAQVSKRMKHQSVVKSSRTRFSPSAECHESSPCCGKSSLASSSASS